MQAANAFLLFSYLTYDILLLRITLAMAGLLFLLWAVIVLDIALDTAIWNLLFFLINTAYAVQIAYARRPIKFRTVHEEELYRNLFAKVGVSRIMFQSLLSHALVRRLKAGTTYIEAGNEAANLSIVISGVVSVISKPADGSMAKLLSTITKHEFIESPQWAARSLFVGAPTGGEKNDKVSLGVVGVATRPPELSIEVAAADGDSGDSGDGGGSAAAGTSAGVQSNEDTGGDAKRAEGEPAPGTSGYAARASDIDTRLLELAQRQQEQDESDAARRAAQVLDVTMVADTDLVLLQWPAERLAVFCEDNPGINAPLNAVVGADVALKLFRESRMQALQSQDEDEHGPLGVGLELTTPAHLGVIDRLRHDEEKNAQLLRALVGAPGSIKQSEADVLLRLGKWRYIRRVGTVLQREGEPVTSLAIVLDGRLAATKGEDGESKQLHFVAPPQLAGSIEFLDGDAEHLSAETLTAVEAPVTYFLWDAADLRAAVRRRPSLRAALATLVAVDVTRKYRELEARL